MRPKRLRRWIMGLAALVATTLVFAASPVSQLAAAEPALDNGAVLLMYHRFGENQYPTTNVRLEQFETHLSILSESAYRVLPLSQIVQHLDQNETLPDRTIAITIDDAFRSVYREAWPRLRNAGLPFTLFVATSPLDTGAPDYMTWDQLREMLASDLVTLGGHSVDHGHMLEHTPEQNRTELLAANQRFRDELGVTPEVFAYPYGEYNLALRDLVDESGFRAGFGQQSGALSRLSDRFALPRFPLNEAYGEEDRFRLVINALPLPVADITPPDPQLSGVDNPPAYGFTVAGSIGSTAGLACYGGGETLPLERLGELRIEVRPTVPFAPGRNRINCTLLGPDSRWRWFGRQFYLPPK